MEFVKITHENLADEHICCAISNNNDCQVASKKSWLSERIDDGLVFLKGNVRGKCFIEYIPAEKAWAPIDAAGYMYIDCFWISGQFKGHGYSNELLEECIRDSREKGKIGLCVLSSRNKKMPFLSDPKYLSHKGFITADTANPHFSLLYLPFDSNAPAPKFKPCAKSQEIPQNGFVLYYTNQCPYTAKYVPLIEAVAVKNNVALKSVHISSAEQAQVAPTPFTSYTMFYNGKFLTNEILSENKFQKLIDETV